MNEDRIERRSDTMKPLILEGNVDGKEPTGRSPALWLDPIKSKFGLILPETCHSVVNRETSNTTVAELT